MKIYLVSFIFTVIVPTFGLCLSSDDYDIVYSELEAFMSDSLTHLPTAVRLTFHDCVGGCDGCINIDDSHNNGLQDCLEDLEVLYDSETIAATGISRADFWVMASYAAIDNSIKRANRNKVDDCTRATNDNFPYCNWTTPDFKGEAEFGRVDCNTDSYTTTDLHDFPNADMTSDETTEYFAGQFGLNAEESVALMGAHTLGSCTFENSGFAGPWVNEETNFFDSGYFDLMEDADVWWEQQDNVRNTGNNQFTSWTNATGIKAGFMLNTDFGLLYDLQLDDEKHATCKVDQNYLASGEMCGDAPTASYVRNFQGNTQVWIDEFWVALKKMQGTLPTDSTASLSNVTV